MKHLLKYSSYESFRDDSPDVIPMIAAMPDRDGRFVFMRNSDGNEEMMTSGKAYFRCDASFCDGQALLD